MVTRAQMDRLKQAADERRAARAAMPDVSAFGDLVASDEFTRLYFDGQDSALLTRGGSALRVVGLDIRCATGGCDHDHRPPPPEQPQPVGPEHPQPARNHQPGTSSAPEQPPADEQPSGMDANLAAIADSRWSKHL